MTVKECYEIMKGDYDDVISRLRTDDRVKKFLSKVLSDPSFSQAGLRRRYRAAV